MMTNLKDGMKIKPQKLWRYRQGFRAPDWGILDAFLYLVSSYRPEKAMKTGQDVSHGHWMSIMPRILEAKKSRKIDGII